MPQPFNLRVRCRTSNSSKAKARSPQNLNQARRSKTSNWRDKIKETDPERYARILEYGKTYSRLQRLNMSLAKSDLEKRNLPAAKRRKAEELVEKQKQYNAGCARRMRKMRAKKKAEKESNRQPKQRSTRAQEQLQKERMAAVAAKRREERANMTPAERAAYLKNRRMRYALKTQKTKLTAVKADQLQEQQKELEKEKRRLEEIECNLNQQMLELEQMKMDLQEKAQDVRNPAARRKSLQRVRKAMPKQPAQFANTATDLIKKASPRKAAAMRDKNISPTEGKMEAALQEVVASCLSEPKQSATRRSVGSSMHILKKHKLMRKVSKKFGVSRKLLSKAKKYTAGRKPLPQTTVKAVQEFYESIGNSLPDKKMVSKRTGKSAKLIDRSILTAYQQFVTANPDVKISISKFFQLRPKHVKTQQRSRYRGCLCEYCTNVSLKLKVINTHLSSVDTPQFNGVYDIVNATMCEKPPNQDFHHPDCVKRKCELCGVGKLDDRLSPLMAQGSKAVQWQKWDLVMQQVQSGATKPDVRKRALVTKTGDLQTMLKELQNEVNMLSEHLFNKDWQNTQLQYLRSNLPKDSCLCILDFAENYTCCYQDEVQGAYWTQNAATVHPIVCYYHCNQCEEVLTESLVFISDDLNHDYHAVNAFQTTACQHLKETRQLQLSHIYRYSDGCAQQYKSKGPFSDVSYGSTDFGVLIHHNFSGSRHGKGASDGESAVVKSAATTAVKVGAAVIRNAEELYQFAQENLTKSPDTDCCKHYLRTCFYIPSASIDRNRDHRYIKTVPGTMKLHSIKTVQDGIVATRNLSCFCKYCLQGSGGSCQNSLFVEDWQEVKLYNRCSSIGKHILS